MRGYGRNWYKKYHGCDDDAFSCYGASWSLSFLPFRFKGTSLYFKVWCIMFVETKITPVQYILCFNLCMVGCRISPSDVVYNCTQDCAQSKTINFESGIRISSPNFLPHFALLFISSTFYLTNKHRLNVLNCCFSLLQLLNFKFFRNQMLALKFFLIIYVV